MRNGPPPTPPPSPGPTPPPRPDPTPPQEPEPIPLPEPGPFEGAPRAPSGSPRCAMFGCGSLMSGGMITVGSAGNFGFSLRMITVGGVICSSENFGSLPSDDGSG